MLGRDSQCCGMPGVPGMMLQAHTPPARNLLTDLPQVNIPSEFFHSLPVESDIRAPRLST